jgi:SAM-dependent methyltransferase
MAEDDLLAGSGSDYSDATEVIPPIHAHGHKYHHSGKIYTPCDESTRDVEHVVHEVFKSILGGRLSSVTLSTTKPLQILDLGTGTGLWAIDMGLAYPLAQVTGIDISPFLLPAQMPRNVNFEVEDLETEDGDGDRIGMYDLIHMRGLGPAGIRDWPAFIKRLYTWLKPGGWIEIAGHSLEGLTVKSCAPASIQKRWFKEICGVTGEQQAGESSEDDNSLQHQQQQQQQPGLGEMSANSDGWEQPKSEALNEFIIAWFAASQALGVHFNPPREASRWVVEAGFEKVTQVNEVIPLQLNNRSDSAARHIHALFWTLFSKEGLSHFCLRYITASGHDAQRMSDVIGQIAQDLQTTMVGSHGYIRFCSGRKPLVAEQ